MYHIKNNGKFVTLRMNGTWGYAPNMNFAYPFETLEEAQRFVKPIKRLLFDNPTEITDATGKTISNN
jgi:hypothetical protein